MNRASDVPPVVERTGLQPVTASTDSAIRLTKGPGFVRKATALVGAKMAL